MTGGRGRSDEGKKNDDNGPQSEIESELYDVITGLSTGRWLERVRV